MTHPIQCDILGLVVSDRVNTKKYILRGNYQMGENEQGGMLRVVVVVGLVALIAAVVIYAVIQLKGTMSSTTSGATSNVTSAINSNKS